MSLPVQPQIGRQNTCIRKLIFAVTCEFAFWYPWVVDPFSTRDSYCLVICLVLYPRNLAWQLPDWGPQKYGWTGKWGAQCLRPNMAGQKWEWHSICDWDSTDGCSSQKNCLNLYFHYLWEKLRILGRQYLLHALWGCRLLPKSCAILPIKSLSKGHNGRKKVGCSFPAICANSGLAT